MRSISHKSQIIFLIMLYNKLMKKAEASPEKENEQAVTKMAVLVAVILLFVLCYCSCLFSGALLWVNDQVGGLGNPYILWP